MSWEYPTEEEWKEIYRSFPAADIVFSEYDFNFAQKKGLEGLNQLTTIKEINAWIMALENKWKDVARSYVMMNFYYDKGIPDEPYFISPGRKGESVEYFPNFKKVHYVRKDAFDFYADVYFFKVFSAFDGLWQLFNVYFKCGLDIHKVTFESLCKRLEDKKTADHLRIILADERYGESNKIRNAFVHRLPPQAQGPGISRKENTIGFGISEYTSSKQIAETAHRLLSYCVETHEKIRTLFRANPVK